MGTIPFEMDTHLQKLWKQIRQIYGDALIFGGNANYPMGFLNVKKRMFRPKEDPPKSFHLLFKIKDIPPKTEQQQLLKRIIIFSNL